jgi:hypothetical protein
MGPGLVFANPFKGKSLRVKLGEQSSILSIALTVTHSETVRWSYKITDVEKAVRMGISYAMNVLLEKADLPEKEKLREIGNYNDAMLGIGSFVSYVAIHRFRFAAQAYESGIIDHKEEIETKWKIDMQQDFAGRGVELIDASIISNGTARTT